MDTGDRRGRRIVSNADNRGDSIAVAATQRLYLRRLGPPAIRRERLHVAMLSQSSINALAFRCKTRQIELGKRRGDDTRGTTARTHELVGARRKSLQQ